MVVGAEPVICAGGRFLVRRGLAGRVIRESSDVEKTVVRRTYPIDSC